MLRPLLVSGLLLLLCYPTVTDAYSDSDCWSRNITNDAGDVVGVKKCSGHGTCDEVTQTCKCSLLSFEHDGRASGATKKPACPFSLRTGNPTLFAAYQWVTFTHCLVLFLLSVRGLYGLRLIGRLKANVQTTALSMVLTYASLNTLYYGMLLILSFVSKC